MAGAKEIRSVAVMGAGHGGYAAAADLTRRGFEVRLHARREERLKPIRANGGIDVRGIFEGREMPALLTTDVAEAIAGTDLVMLVVPSVAHAWYAERLAGVLAEGTPVFLDPGHTGGGLHFRAEMRRAGHTAPFETCETVTLTFICRIEAPARVGIYSYTKSLMFAALGEWVVPQLMGGGKVNMIGRSTEDALSTLNYPTAASLSAFVLAVLVALLAALTLLTRRRGGIAGLFEALKL